MTSSDTELLQTTDFQVMSAAEIVEAEHRRHGPGLSDATVAAVRGGTFRWPPVVQAHAAPDGTMGGCAPVQEQRQQKLRPVVVICDISGSMERYSRMLLRAHALTLWRGTVHSFLFGTRLTNVAQMKDRDPDAALRASTLCGGLVDGTQISSALHASIATGRGACSARARSCC